VNRPCGTHVVVHSSTNLHTCIQHIPTLIFASTCAFIYCVHARIKQKMEIHNEIIKKLTHTHKHTHKHTHTHTCLHTGGREAVGGEQLRIIRAIKPLRFFKIARLMKLGKVHITPQMYQRIHTYVHTHIRTQNHVHTHVASWPIARDAVGLPEYVAFYYLFISHMHRPAHC
jgi:hypothetical protein